MEKEKTKKQEIEDYLQNMDKLVSLSRIIYLYGISKSYAYHIVRELIQQGKIDKVEGEIKYYIWKK